MLVTKLFFKLDIIGFKNYEVHFMMIALYHWAKMSMGFSNTLHIELFENHR